RGQEELDLEIGGLLVPLVGGQIDDDEGGERLLIGFVRDHELTEPRGRGPVHVPQVVSGHILTGVEVTGGGSGDAVALVAAGGADGGVLRNASAQRRHGHGDGEDIVDLPLHLDQAEGAVDGDEHRREAADAASVRGEGGEHGLLAAVGQGRDLAGGGIAEAFGGDEVD